MIVVVVVKIIHILVLSQCYFLQATLILFLSQKGPTFEFCIKLYIINYFVVQVYNRNLKIHVLYLICCARKQYYIAVNLAFDYNAVHYSFVIIYCMFSIVHDILLHGYCI